MDITAIFKAGVKTIRLKNRTNHQQYALPQQQQPQSDKNNNILKKISKAEFTIKTKDICHQLTQLRNLLIENRSAYMRFACHLKGSMQMSDNERDIIDDESEKILHICCIFIKDLKEDCNKKRNTLKRQMYEHMEMVLDLLNDYLLTIQNLYIEQKNYRIQHELDTYRLLKLESNKKLIPITPATTTRKRNIGRQPIMDGENDINDNKSDINCDDTTNNDLFKSNINNYNNGDINIRNVSGDNSGGGGGGGSDNTEKSVSERIFDENLANRYALQQEQEEEVNDISTDDIQMFESENMQLYNELKGLSDEVQQIERNVVDIAKLQDLFSEKVIVQKADIERIASTVVGATENVKDANEQIKQAIQRNAGLRVYVLFFLLIMSLTLLFLDWYND